MSYEEEDTYMSGARLLEDAVEDAVNQLVLAHPLVSNEQEMPLAARQVLKQLPQHHPMLGNIIKQHMRHERRVLRTIPCQLYPPNTHTPPRVSSPPLLHHNSRLYCCVGGAAGTAAQGVVLEGGGEKTVEGVSRGGWEECCQARAQHHLFNV